MASIWFTNCEDYPDFVGSACPETTVPVSIDGSNYCPYISGGQVRKKVTVISGLSHLNGQVVSVQVDGGIPAATQTFTVSGGAITLVNPAAVVHVGLPYVGKLKFLPLGAQTKSEKLFIATFRLWKSLGGMFGKTEDELFPIIPDTQNPNVISGDPVELFTGDQEIDFEPSYDKDWSPVLLLEEPLPFMLLAVVFKLDILEDK